MGLLTGFLCRWLGRMRRRSISIVPWRRAICQRFLPHHMDAFDDAIARSLERTAVVKITLTEPPVGKRKQYDKQGEEMTGQSSESHHACMNGRVAKEEDEVKYGRMK